MDPSLRALAGRTFFAVLTMFGLLTAQLEFQRGATVASERATRLMSSAQRLALLVERAGLYASMGIDDEQRERLDATASAIAGALEALRPGDVPTGLDQVVARTLRGLEPTLEVLLSDLRTASPSRLEAVVDVALDEQTRAQLEQLVVPLSRHLAREAEHAQVIQLGLLSLDLLVLVLLTTFVLAPAARRARRALSARALLHHVALLAGGGHPLSVVTQKAIERVCADTSLVEGVVVTPAPPDASPASAVGDVREGIPSAVTTTQPRFAAVPIPGHVQSHGLMLFFGPETPSERLIGVLEGVAERIGRAFDRDEVVRADRNRAAVLTASTDAILSVSETGRVVTCNPAAATTLGWARDEVVGRPLPELAPDEQRADVEGLIAQLAAGARVEEYELQWRTSSGQARLLSLSAAPIAGDEGTQTVAAVVARDITQQRAVERRIRETTEELRRSNAELEKFAYVVSHDLKAPMRAIDNLSRWIVEDLEDLDDETRERLALMRSRVKRMERLLDSLLEYSRAGRRGTTPERVSLRRALDEVAQLVAAPDGFEIQLDVEQEWITAVAAPLKQVLLNLVANAVKHHDRPTGRVRVACRADGDMWRLSVSDDGPGIPADAHERVFEIFQTIQSRDRVEGAGMGLAIVAKVIDTFGGRITLESSGRGSVFEFTWPMEDA